MWTVHCHRDKVDVVPSFVTKCGTGSRCPMNAPYVRGIFTQNLCISSPVYYLLWLVCLCVSACAFTRMLVCVCLDSSAYERGGQL